MPADPAATRRLIESLSTHLEDHLATWKSSLVDARREIETLLAAVSEKIPAGAKPLFPEDVVSVMLEDVLPPPPPPPPPPTPEIRVVEKIVERTVPGPAAPPDWTLVRGAVSSIESARTQVDVLTRFISQAAAHASRVALLVLRNDRITGWKSIGFDASGGRDEAVRSIDLGAEDDPFAAEVLRAQRSRLAEPPSESSPLRKALGGRAPERSLLVPMVIRDRLAGLVYADELTGEESRLNEGAIEVLTFITGLAVDLLAARKKIPSPTLTPTGDSIERFRPEAAEAPARKPPPSLVFETGAAKPAPPQEAPRPAPAEPLISTSGIRPRPKAPEEQLRALAESAGLARKPAPPPPADTGVTVAVPVVVPTPAPPPPPVPARPHEAAPPPAAPGATAAPLPPPSEPTPAVSAEAPSPAPKIPGPTPPPVPTRPPSSFPPPLSQTTTGEFTEAVEALRASGAAPPPAPSGAPGPSATPAPMTPPPTIPAVGARPSTPSPSTEVRPISGFIPRSRLAPKDTDTPQRQRDDARRLARLLVSEIKLYNEKKVDEGRAANDLYGRLKDDIERSRQVFEERTPETLRRETDFFQEELVRILADGHPEALGPMG
jgi:hypothetical protein